MRLSHSASAAKTNDLMLEWPLLTSEAIFSGTLPITLSLFIFIFLSSLERRHFVKPSSHNAFKMQVKNLWIASEC